MTAKKSPAAKKAPERKRGGRVIIQALGRPPLQSKQEKVKMRIVPEEYVGVEKETGMEFLFGRSLNFYTQMTETEYRLRDAANVPDETGKMGNLHKGIDLRVYVVGMVLAKRGLRFLPENIRLLENTIQKHTGPMSTLWRTVATLENKLAAAVARNTEDTQLLTEFGRQEIRKQIRQEADEQGKTAERLRQNTERMIDSTRSISALTSRVASGLAVPSILAPETSMGIDISKGGRIKGAFTIGPDMASGTVMPSDMRLADIPATKPHPTGTFFASDGCDYCHGLLLKSERKGPGSVHSSCDLYRLGMGEYRGMSFKG